MTESHAPGPKALEFVGTLAVIGGGRMGEAIFAGLIASGTVPPSAVVVAEPDQARGRALRSHGVSVVREGREAADGASIVILAVKPQVIDVVVRELGDVGGALVVSIAAGISCVRLESALAPGTKVVRVMPNTPALVRAGMALISGGTETNEAEVELVRSLFAAIGDAIVIDERYQDAGTAISGSGPAYFALVVDSLARAGVAQGLSREVSQALAVQTMLGTALLLTETGMHPAELMDGVASPGGTTIAALGELEAGGVRAAFSSAVAAAVRRAKELGA